ncbi:MAG: tandem-95 repeat protein, partial [Planctomycetales bacterium]|nr:tandem-95 repeat protein [Planctomycetales bacterium]
LVLEFAPEESGSANLTIRLTDEAGLTAESVLRVNVAAVNNPPVVSQLLQPLFVDEDANINTISLVQYFSDSDSVLAYRVAGISNPQLFSQVHVNSTTGSLSIALTPQASGRGEITLAAVDPAGLTATQILVVNVLPVNDPPTAVGWGTVLIAEDTTRSVNLRDGFRDGDDGSTALAFQILDNSAPLLFRSLTVNPDTGELLIRPAPNNSGPATLTIRATDPHGSYVDEALTIVVQPVNDSPVSLDAPDVVVPRGTTSSVVQLANYYHDDDDPLLEYRVISNSNSPLFSKVVLGKASGQLTLTYADNAYGFADLRIRVTDPAGAYVEETIRVRVLGSPHPVDGIPDIEVFEDAAPTEINLPSVFLDLEDKTQPVSFSVTSITNAQLFTSVLVDPGNGTLRVSYAPNASGEADITVTATDSSGATSSDTFRVRIKPVNDHPTATAIPTVTVTEDAPATVIKLAEFFSDIEDSLLSYTIRSVGDADILGSAYVEDGTTNLVIIPRANAFGSTVLTVQAADSQGATVTETVHVEVVSVNDTPQPAKVSVLHLMQRPAPITINLRDLFRDADHPVTALSFRVKDVINAPLIQTKTIDQANGTLTLIVSPTRFGFAEIVIEATDPQSGKGDARLMVFVEQDNSDNGQIVDDVSAGPSTDTATVELRSAFSSIDNGGTLRYTLLSNSQPSLFRSVSFYNSTGKLILDFKNTADGQATLTVLATNQQGDTAVVAFSVTARPTSAAPPDIGSGLPRDGTLGDANPDINSPSSTPPTDNATADRQRALLEFVESHSDERPSNTVTIVPTSTTVGQTDRPGLRSNVHPDDDHDEYESSMAALLQQIAPEANPYTTILSEMTSSRQTVTRGDSLTSEDAMGPSLSVLATSASTSDGRRHLSESIAPTEVTPDPYLEAATSSSLPSQSTPDIDSAQPQPANSPSPAPLMPAPPPTGSAESSGPTSADDRAVGDRDPAPDVA